jgi:tetratricopeptide (TPR) repeat protein
MDIPLISMINRERARTLQVLILALAVALYIPGLLSGLWVTVFPLNDRLISGLFGFVLSWLFARLVVSLYQRVMFRVALPDLQRGLRHIQAGEMKPAFSALVRQIAQLDTHPIVDQQRFLRHLNPVKYSYREVCLLNLAHTAIQLGEGEKALAYYEQCLNLNPGNEMAISSLNLVNALQGGEIRPVGKDIPFNRMVDRRLRRRMRLIQFALVLVFFTPCAILLVPPLGLTGGIVAVVGAWGWSIVLTVLYRFVTGHVLLVDYVRGFKHLQAGEFGEAVTSFQKQLAFLEESPWLDHWRWLILLAPTRYSYREWMLLYLAYTHTQLGHGDRAIDFYRRCLQLNPDNGLAASTLSFVEALT